MFPAIFPFSHDFPTFFPSKNTKQQVILRTKRAPFKEHPWLLTATWIYVASYSASYAAITMAHIYTSHIWIPCMYKYIYVYIYMCVCVCICIYMCVDLCVCDIVWSSMESHNSIKTLGSGLPLYYPTRSYPNFWAVMMSLTHFHYNTCVFSIFCLALVKSSWEPATGRPSIWANGVRLARPSQLQVGFTV